MKSSIFEYLKMNFYVKKSLCMKLHAIEHRLNTNSKLYALQYIHSFAYSRKVNSWLEKERAVGLIMKTVKLKILEVKADNFQYLVKKLFTRSNKMKAATMINDMFIPDKPDQFNSRHVRKYFDIWKNHDKLTKFIEFQNEQGTKKLQIYKNKQDLQNVVDV